MFDHWRAQSPTRREDIRKGGRGRASRDTVCVVGNQGPPATLPDTTVIERVEGLKSRRNAPVPFGPAKMLQVNGVQAHVVNNHYLTIHKTSRCTKKIRVVVRLAFSVRIATPGDHTTADDEEVASRIEDSDS